MKKQFTLALVALATLCALTGCGNRKETADNHNAGTSVTTPNGSSSTTNPNGSHSVTGDMENGIADTGEAIRDGMDDMGDAITGDRYNNGATSNGGTAGGSTSNGGASSHNGTASSGVPYDTMLNNGTVHDTDGILTDGENSRSR